jgi:hypothetical protein
MTETPDESIPQDPGIPGPGTKEKGDWPPESDAAPSDRCEEREETSVSEAVGRMPRHRAEEKRKTER